MYAIQKRSRRRENCNLFGNLPHMMEIFHIKEGEKMCGYLSASPGQENTKRIVAGILLISLLILGNGGLGVASESPPPCCRFKELVSRVCSLKFPYAWY